jgi:hypothetical protein
MTRTGENETFACASTLAPLAMRRVWCGNQQVGRSVTLADSTVCDREPRTTQRVDHLGYGCQCGCGTG